MTQQLESLANADHLIAFFRQQRDKLNYSENFRLRIHRALSWLKKAEDTAELDSKFIFLWIAFNAAYAREILNLSQAERAKLNEFILRICALDEQKQLYHLVWKKLNHPIRCVMNNPYIFQPFWDFHNGLIEQQRYLTQQQQEQNKLYSALKKQETGRILFVLFNRLYTLRNQILHGGATFNSQVNRQQLTDCCQILSLLLPTMLSIMLQNHAKMDWGKPFYPLVKNPLPT